MAGCFSWVIYAISVPVTLIIGLILLFFLKIGTVGLICLVVFLLFILWGKLESRNYDKSSPRLYEAERAKRFLGFDFGDKFRLRKTGSHDYEEILLDFDEEEFKPLEEFCKSQKENIEKQDGTKRSIIKIKHFIDVTPDEYVIKKGELYKASPVLIPGFTKEEINYDLKVSSDWISSILTMEIDYEARTLKFSYSGF